MGRTGCCRTNARVCPHPCAFAWGKPASTQDCEQQASWRSAGWPRARVRKKPPENENGSACDVCAFAERARLRPDTKASHRVVSFSHRSHRASINLAQDCLTAAQLKTTSRKICIYVYICVLYIYTYIKIRTQCHTHEVEFAQVSKFSLHMQF